MLLLLAMGSVLLTWLVLAALTAGAGLGVLRLLGWRAVGTDHVLGAFWVGYALQVMVLQIWSFAAPASAAAAITLGAIGIAGLAVSARRLRRWAAAAIPRRAGTIALVLAAGAWVANQAIGPGDAHDSGLYHYGIILWNSSYPVVPGLANLSPPLAMNNASLLHAAAFDVGPWQGRVEHIANGLLLWMLWVTALVSIVRLLRARRRRGAADLFRAVLIAPAVMLLFSREVASPKTDLPQALLLYAMIAIAVGVLSRPATAARSPRTGRGVLSVNALAAAAVCVKLSSLVFAGAAALLVMAWWWPRARATRRPAVVAAAIAVWTLLLVPWMGRNVVMSGYPLYPSTAIAVPLPWQIEAPKVEQMTAVIRDHGRARLPLLIWQRLDQSPLRWYADLMEPPFRDFREVVGWEWVRPWLLSLPFTGPVELVMPVGVAVLALAAFVLRRRRPGAAGVIAWLLAPAAAGLLFWVSTAPDPRYIYGVAWITAALALALLRASSGGAIGRAPIHVALCIALALPALGYQLARVSFLDQGDVLAQIPFRGPGPDRGFHPIPQVEHRVWRTRAGLEVNVPAGEFTKCWRCPLPCTSWWLRPEPDLRLRREGDLGSGFVIDTLGLGE